MMNADRQNADTATLLEFMYRLGQGYLACGEQTALVELFLRRVATVQGARRARVVAFPTALFITLHDGEGEQVTLAEGPIQTLRLDQIADVYHLGESAQSGEVGPDEGLTRLKAILNRPSRFGDVGVIVGHTVLTVGLSLVLAPSGLNALAAAVLGLVVGSLKAFNRNRPLLSAPLAVVAAAIVSALVFLAIRYGVALSPLDAIVPPLVTFLPGAMLTFGMVELAYGDMVSGSSRLITGFVQLVLLTFGLAIGAILVGVGAESLSAVPGNAAVPVVAAAWWPWIGVLVFGVGVFLHFSAPRNALPWIIAVLLPTFAVQRGAAELVGTEISGFFGTLVATPLGYLVQQRFHGPPSMVTFLPSFWILVPGALGLLSVTRMLNDRAAGVDGVVSALFAIASIALGTLVGASLYKWLTESLGLWRLQIGRASTLFRRTQRRTGGGSGGGSGD